MAAKFIGKIKVIATRFVGAVSSDHPTGKIAIKIGGGIAWYNGTFMELGIVDGYETRADGLYVRFVRLYDKNWLDHQEDPRGARVGENLEEWQCMQAAEGKEREFVKADQILKNIAILSSDLWADNLKRTTNHYEVVAIVKEVESQNPLRQTDLKFYLINPGTVFEQ